MVSAVTGTDPLATPVYAAGGYKPFGQFTLPEVRARADELSQASGWGPTARIATVARGWSDLAAEMERCGAATVAELQPALGAEFARRAWVGASLL